MNIDINSPEIKILLRSVEERIGITPRLVSEFTQLADRLYSEGPERISQSTLERLWQYSTRRNATVSLHTLDVLSRYLGHSGWDGFQKFVQTSCHPESGYFSDGILDVESLQEGSRLSLTWLPDRKITIRFLGRCRFVVEESLNSSLRTGDSFECLQIQASQPLYLDRFRRAGEPDDGKNARYVVGRDSGILSLEILSRQKT